MKMTFTVTYHSYIIWQRTTFSIKITRMYTQAYSTKLLTLSVLLTSSIQAMLIKTILVVFHYYYTIRSTLLSKISTQMSESDNSIHEICALLGC